MKTILLALCLLATSTLAAPFADVIIQMQGTNTSIYIVDTARSMHPASAQDLLTYSNQIQTVRDAASDYDKWTDLRAKALVKVLVSEINLLRDWDSGMTNAVAKATSLSNLQVRVSALPAMPDRTKKQAVNAIEGNMP
jgi:hypothetical protein